MSLNFTIRFIEKSEIPQLTKFFYEAIFIPEGQDKPDPSIIELPELSVYYKDFGKQDDICFVAETEGTLMGAIWTRIFEETEPGYGYVDAKTPELSMSVLKEYRNKGIGSELLKTMINELMQGGYDQVSLSVDTINYAYPMYKKFGFTTLFIKDDSATMVKKLK